MFNVKVTAGKKALCVPAIVLEGLHFDILLGVSYTKQKQASKLKRVPW